MTSSFRNPVYPLGEVAVSRFAIAIEFEAVGSIRDLSPLIVCCDRAQSLGIAGGVALSIALLEALERDGHGEAVR